MNLKKFFAKAIIWFFGILVIIAVLLITVAFIIGLVMHPAIMVSALIKLVVGLVVLIGSFCLFTWAMDNNE